MSFECHFFSSSPLFARVFRRSKNPIRSNRITKETKIPLKRRCSLSFKTTITLSQFESNRGKTIEFHALYCLLMVNTRLYLNKNY